MGPRQSESRALGGGSPAIHSAPTSQAAWKSFQVQSVKHFATGLLFFLSPSLQPWEDQKPMSKGKKETSVCPLVAGFLSKAGPS